MDRVSLNLILDGVFRLNPAYELASFDRLTSHQQQVLKGLTDDPDFYGVLLPRTAGRLGIKSVCSSTALLVSSLVEPGQLPAFLQQSLGDDSNEAVARLVLDQILEIDRDGRFISGPEAYPVIFASNAGPKPQGLLPALSKAALEYGQALQINDINRLAARLYFYNRIPLNAGWSRRFSSESAVSKYLDMFNLTNHIRKDWIRVEYEGAYRGWFQWLSRSGRPSVSTRTRGYKLYVSPSPDALPIAFSGVVEVLNESTAYSFKVGRDAIGLLRPDKLVLYFWDFDSLQQTATELKARFSGCAAQGVPFTAAISEDGLLSWGIDPAPEKGILSLQAPESWRVWVTNRLASGIVSAMDAPAGAVQPWQFALDRLRLENVDAVTWAPTGNFGIAAE